MKLKTITIRNFRRLKRINIELDKKTSIFVGSNNSGKTSVAHILHMFLDSSSRPSFSIHDFSSDCWKEINSIEFNDGSSILELPSISLDLWFEVESQDVHRVLDLLPSLQWKDKPVGVRIEYRAKDSDTLLANYKIAKEKSQKNRKDGFEPWPKSVTDYLQKSIKSEYEIHYYVLDREQFNDDFEPKSEYQPMSLGSKERSGKKILDSLIKVDMLHAQRYLGDQNISGRSEDLSKRMNRFYDQNLQKKDDDFDALRALANSESELTKHLNSVFDSTLKSLNRLGYPGFSNPKLELKASLNHETIGGQTKLHYSIGNEGLTLPDSYNGLGFKNLIYMVIEILDFHARWEEDKEFRAPLHLIIIEEPEAHLHAQIQQVFIRKIWEIIKSETETQDIFQSQVIVTTHSPHIIYESGFQPIRYFQRYVEEYNNQTTNVLNLSLFYEKSSEKSREFLQRYMKLTHCDLFFADAAILVEGNVERLLLPLMINKVAEDLNKCYITTIEVGGAYSHIFKNLIDFLGLTTLIITDLDSIKPIESIETLSPIVEGGLEEKKSGETSQEENISEVMLEEVSVEQDEDESEGEEEEISGACIPETLNAITSNQTLIKWLPKLKKIEELLTATKESKIKLRDIDSKALVHVVYQNREKISWEGKDNNYAGRTFEESFALENLDWTQNIKQKDLGLRVITLKDRRTLEDVRERLFKKVRQSNFNKTDFALGLIMKEPTEWNVPSYIKEGLIWLEGEAAPKQENDEPTTTVDALVETVSIEEEIEIKEADDKESK